MAMQVKDTYRVECMYGISPETLRSLTTLYQPLIGGDGLLIYLTLAAESNITVLKSISRIVALTGIPIDTLERSIARLEEYMLVRTYRKGKETSSSYVFLLNLPLSAEAFTANGIYMSRYMNAVGNKQAELSVSFLTSGRVSVAGYEDITHAVKNLRQDDLERDISFVTVKPQLHFSEEDVTIRFDYEKFLSIASTLVFPVELRTAENMNLIGKLATLYGLSADRMLILVKRSINLSTMELDTEKLKIIASREKADVEAGKDPYDMSPVSFLQAKQNGAEVSYTDKKILEHLSNDMKFSNAVINVMIEYILNVSLNRLTPKFVDMVAGEWARDNVQTKQQAIEETKKQLAKKKTNTSHVSIDMPEYIKQQRSGTLPKQEKASKEKITAIQEMQRKLKEQNETD